MVDATHAAPVIAREGLPVFNVAGATLRTFIRAMPIFLALGLASMIPTFIQLAFFPPISTRLTLTTAVATGVHMLVLYFFQIPLTYVAVRLFEGRDYSLAEGFNLALRRYLPVLGATILTLLAIYGGMILLIVPGIVFAAMFAVVVPVSALESRGPIDAMKRSKTLTQFNRWRVLGVYLVFFLPLMILSGVLAVLVTMRGHMLLGQWINVAIQIFWVPLASIFGAAIYTALRRLKDGIGFGVASVFD